MLLKPKIHIKWLGKSAVFPGNSKERSKGLTKTLKKNVFPGLTYGRLANVTKNTGGRSKNSARIYGCGVDRLITAWAQAAGTKDVPRRSYTEVNAFVAWCGQHNLTPITAQMLVGDPTKRLATFIDVVLYHACTKTLVITEIKCGCVYRDCMVINKTTKRPKTTPFAMNAVGDKFATLSFRHMHETQALAGRHLMEKSIEITNTEDKPIDRVECLLCYLNADEVDVSATPWLSQVFKCRPFGVSWSLLTSCRLMTTRDQLACRPRRTKRKRRGTSRRNKRIRS